MGAYGHFVRSSENNGGDRLPSKAEDYLVLVPVLILLGLFFAGFVIFHVNSTQMESAKVESVTPR